MIGSLFSYCDLITKFAKPYLAKCEIEMREWNSEMQKIYNDKRHVCESAFDPSRFYLILFTLSSGIFGSSASPWSLRVPLTILFSHASSRIHLSLFNFVRRVSVAAPRVTCHPDLIVYHWCHHVAAARRIRALQRVSFLRGGEFRGRFATWMSRRPNWMTAIFPFLQRALA